MSDPEKNLHEIRAEQLQGIRKKTIDKLGEFENQLGEITFLEWFRQKAEQEQMSLTDISKQVGIGRPTLHSLASRYEIPFISWLEAIKAKWQEPEYRARMIESGKATLAVKWQDPEFRQQQAEKTRAQWEDPEFRRRWEEGMKTTWQDPEFRIRNAEGIRANWQDPEFRKRHAEGNRRLWEDPEYKRRMGEIGKTTLERLRQDPEWRARNLAGVRASWAERWQNPDFRTRMFEVHRQIRLDPRYLNRWVLPTIYGERWDVGYAQSAWEANVARVLNFVGRTVSLREPLRLIDNNIFEVDFLSIDNQGRLVGYEIMAHPGEDPEGWDKLESAINQYPEITFRVVDRKFYRRLEKRFAKRINLDPRFAGWENGADNLRINPDKYASFTPINPE